MMNVASAVLMVMCGGALLSVGEASVLTYNLGCPVLRDWTYPDTEYIFFRLYTSNVQTAPENINISTNNLAATSYKAANPTKIIIHGFNDSYIDPYLLDVKREYLIKGACNIIMVDWSVLAAGALSCYPTTQNYASYVGRNLAILVNSLRNAGATNIHVIGQSLGAHIANFAANNLKPYNMSRITGLDPAGVNFETANNIYRLDATDATFVDNIHTNVYAAGIAAPTGHVDAYFNGGTQQPGCTTTNATCSHLRSIQFFAESINSVTGFWGYKCSSFSAYYYGFCWSSPRILLVGENVNQISTRGVISVPTNSAPNFAIGK